MILRDRVAIVTGAGSGIGEAGAAILAREGAHVVVIDINAENAEIVVDRICKAGGHAEIAVVDVTDDKALA
ncbi:SDR family NAD(P)-dependent oxidoreductase, partial [Escherichia coli]|nr:SDR family NAD(P)-dependent oxidoreductase [Escherichia coli]